MKATTLEEALVQTLAVRKRLPKAKLVFFTQLRFRRDTKAARPPTIKAVQEALEKALESGAIAIDGERYVLGAAKVTKAKAASPAKRVRAPAPTARCYFPAVAVDSFAIVRRAIEKRFEIFGSTAESVSFRWRRPTGAGPDFRLEPTTRAMATRLMRSGQKRAIARFESFVALSFDDLDEVLDEANGLIEAQHVITKATRGPMFLAWNKRLVTADGAEISGQPIDR